ncbi:MAG: glycosyltransferase [Clostridiales bacterium]|nr:glycosyltransferase [Clostridiales bacterium]
MRPPWLDEALGSIANQTLRDIEIICIDDGSTDDSPEILKRWAARDRRFVLFSRANGGQGSARNLGIAQARGEFLYFMDSDDVLEVEALEQLVAVLREKALDILYFDRTTIFDTEELATVFSDFCHNDSQNCACGNVYDGPTLLRKLCEDNAFCTCVWVQILRTEFVRENNLSFLPGIIYEDNPFTFEVMLKAKRASHLRRAFYHHRIRENSTMTKAVTFYNVYSYYRCFLAMLQTYSQAEPGLTPENRNVALQMVAAMLNSSRYNYTKLPPEDEFSELGLRENLNAFQVMVSNPARETRRAKELSEKLLQTNTARSELNRKLQQSHTEKSEINRKLQQSYTEKSEINRKLQQSYTEKSEINRKLQTTRDEKKARDAQIRELKAQLTTLKKENASLKKKNKTQEKKLNKLRSSVSFRIGRALTWPVRKARALVKRRHPVSG